MDLFCQWRARLQTVCNFFQNIDQRKNCYKADIGAGSENFVESCPLTTDRRYPTSLVFDGQLVVMGGYNEMQGWLDTVDIKATGGCEFARKDEWKLQRGMYNFCAVTHNNKIYTIGNVICIRKNIACQSHVRGSPTVLFLQAG